MRKDFNVGDIIEFEYTGMYHTETVKSRGKVLMITNYDTVNVAVNSGEVWAMRLCNMKILKVEKTNGDQ